MAKWKPDRVADHLYDFSSGYTDGLLHGQNGWTDGPDAVDGLGRVGILNGKLVCVTTPDYYYAQAWRDDVILDDMVVGMEIPAVEFTGNSYMKCVFMRNQGDGRTYSANLAINFNGTAELSLAYKSSYWGFSYFGSFTSVPNPSVLTGGCYLYGIIEGTKLTVRLTTLDGEILAEHSATHATLTSGRIGLYNNLGPSDLETSEISKIMVWDPDNGPLISGRDTTSTPYRLSWDGACYFRYPSGNLPFPEFFVTQSGAGSRSGTSLADAWAYADINWSSLVPGSTLWICGEVTIGTYFQIDGGGDVTNDLFIRGDYPGNAGILNASRLALRGVDTSYLTIKGLTINGLVRSEAYAYLNYPNVTFTDATTLVRNDGDWPAGILAGDIMVLTGPVANGAAWGYEIASVSGNTITVLDTGRKLFAPEGPIADYIFNWYHKHHNITVDTCLLAPQGDFNGEIVEMNMGDNITLIRTECDGGDHVFQGVTYNEVRKHATMRFNHVISECYFHNIGIPDDGTSNIYDNHAAGIQLVNGYLFEKNYCKDAASGMILFPGNTENGRIPHGGITDMVMRYNRIEFTDWNRHKTQFRACGIMGSGDSNTDRVGSWKIYHNLIIDPLNVLDDEETYSAVACACKGSSADGNFQFYNNTIYNTASGAGWNTGLYRVNLIDGGEDKANIIHGVRQNNANQCQIRTPSSNATYECDYNLYGADWATGFRPPSGATNFAGHQAAGFDLNGAVGDPLLDANFRPQAGSPAIGNGVLMDANQRWLGAVTWPTAPGGGSFEFVDLTGAPTIGAFAESV